jgi:hypothetical protein
VGDCSVAGSGPIDLANQKDLEKAVLLVLFEGAPRTYQYMIPAPLFEKVVGTATACKEEADEGEFEWFPAVGVPLLVNAPLPGGPVTEDWSLSGSGSGDTGPGSPDQTWQWDLHPIP